MEDLTTLQLTPAESFNLFIKNFPESVKEHISINLSFSEDYYILVDFFEDNEIIFSKTFPLFMFPFLIDFLEKTKNSNDEISSDNVFFQFLFEFRFYFTLSNEISVYGANNTVLYSKVYEFIKEKYHNFYGKDAEIAMSDLCYYVNTLLNYPKDLTLEILDENLFIEFSALMTDLTSVSSLFSDPDSQLLFMETVNDTPT